MWGLYGESRATDECEAFGGWARTECKAESSCISQERGDTSLLVRASFILFEIRFHKLDFYFKNYVTF